MRPHRSEYRGSSTHENRIVQSGGDFPSTAFPDRTDDRTGRSIVAGRPAGILRRHAGESSRIAGTPDSWNRGTVAIFENKNRILAPASHMSRYSLWNTPRSWEREQRAFHEKAFR